MRISHHARPGFEIEPDEARLRDDLVIKLAVPTLFQRDQEVSELRVPLDHIGIEKLRDAVLHHALAESPMLLTPTPPSGDYVKLLEERLAKAEERVDRLIAALVDPA